MRLALAAALWLLAAPAHAATWQVHAGESIARALSGAAAGDEVRVGPGTYHEHLSLNRPVKLIGMGRPTLDGDGQGDLIRINAANCTVRGWRLVNGGLSILSDNASIKLASGGNTIADNRMEHCYYGIYMLHADHNQLLGNTILGATRLGSNDRGDGIRLFISQHNRVVGNLIRDTRDGIFFDGSGSNAMANNDIARVRYGLHYMSSDDNAFWGNRFTETEAGSALMFSKRITLHHNLFAGNRGYRAYGLLLKECEDSTVTRNVIAGNRVGIFLDAGIANTLSHNRVEGNDVGIDLRASSEGNHFIANAIVANAEALTMPMGVSENTWDGNYWSDYRGYDLDGDGRGDVPHRAGNLFGYLTENLPPARLFLLSPAIQALEFAERTFPVVQTPQIEEAAPAMQPEPPPQVPGAPAAPAPGQSPLAWVGGAVLLAGALPLWFARKARLV